MVYLFIEGEEGLEQLGVVVEVSDTCELLNAVHGHHAAAYVDALDTQTGRHDGTDGAATRTVVPDYDVLNEHSSHRRDVFQEGPGDTVGGIALVVVGLEHYSLVDSGHVFLLVLLTVVGVHSMGHVG